MRQNRKRCNAAMELKDRILKAMEAAGLSRGELAERTGFTAGSVTHWLGGGTRKIKAETAERIAKVTGFNARWLALGLGPERGPSLANEAYVAGHLKEDAEPSELQLETFEDQLAVLLRSVPESSRTEAYLVAAQALMKFLPGAK